MIPLYLTIFLCLFILVLIVVTQVVIPVLQDTPVFPILRSSPEKKALAKMEDELEEANELAGLQQRIDALQAKVTPKRKDGNQ